MLEVQYTDMTLTETVISLIAIALVAFLSFKIFKHMLGAIVLGVALVILLVYLGWISF